MAAIDKRRSQSLPLGHGKPPTSEQERIPFVSWHIVLALLVVVFTGGLANSAAALTAQTINFGVLAGKSFGAAPFIVSATASSGLTVSFASTTTPICTVSATTVTIVAAGTCTIQASQAGNATYAPAPNVNQSFTVAKKAQTITFAALAGKTYGNPPFTVSATSTSGLVVTLVSTTMAVCTVNTATVAIVTAGTCTIQAQQAGNANYLAATSVSQSFTVAKKAQTITLAALAGKTYGNAPFTVSATSTSGLTVTFVSTTMAVCTVNTATVTIVTAGTCTIQARQAGNANYLAATSVSQSFTVARAAQTITFGALAGKTYGNAPFTLSATASSGLAVAFSSTTLTVCTITGSTVTILAAGLCNVRASQAGNANYNAAANVNQGLTISGAVQTIAFGAIADREIDSPPFDIAATATSGLVVTFVTLTDWACDVAGSTVTLIGAGICTLETQQLGNSNYLAAIPVDRSFTITSAQSIYFPALPNLPVNAGPKILSGSASSGLGITFSSITPATCLVAVQNGTDWYVTPLALGLCTVRATQAGDAIYHAAPMVEKSFSVLVAQRTVQYIYDATGNVIRIQVGGP